MGQAFTAPPQPIAGGRWQRQADVALRAVRSRRVGGYATAHVVVRGQTGTQATQTPQTGGRPPVSSGLDTETGRHRPGISSVPERYRVFVTADRCYSADAPQQAPSRS